MGGADWRGHGQRGGAQELILGTVAAHAESLLRTARRHSLCVDDAHDAYQRALEIFMSRADRLDPARAAAWLHVVVKHEAQAIRSARQKLVTSDEPDLDQHEARSLATPEERLLSFDEVRRSAEALQRLKPQEMRALWLKAQGHSYNDIAAITGWSYTKVNRCLSEGRRSFLERYAEIDSGQECVRWSPVMSAVVDGEATPEQLLELRPHLRNCPGCRATLKALRDSSRHLAAVLPVPLVALEAGAGEHIPSLLMRVYEAVASGMHERALSSYTKAHAVVEAAAAGKVAAVAASAAAVAGSGYATVLERVAERPSEVRPASTAKHESARRTARAAAPGAGHAQPVVVPAPAVPAPPAPPVRAVATATATAAAPQPATSAAEFDLEPEPVARSAAAAGHTPRAGPARVGRPAGPRLAAYAAAQPGDAEFAP